MIKTPRAPQAKITSNIKTENHIEFKLNDLVSNKRVPPLPITGINFSDFKRNLIGLKKFEVIQLLDKPAFKRTEHPASIWQYQSSVCFIDIFFFPNKRHVVVDHVEIRSKNIQRTEEKKCFSSFLDAG